MLIAIMMLVFTACGKQGNPIVLPDREEIISIDVSDEEKSGFSPNAEGEADAQSGEVDEITVIEQEETDTMDKIPMVRVNGKLYYDTGKEGIDSDCATMDGQITSTVDGSEIPTEDNQSNFGSGFGYQYGADDTIEIYMNEKWCIFEYREE